NPTVSLGNVAEMDPAMPKSDDVTTTLNGTVADKLDRLARSNVLIGIAPAIDACGRVESEFCYPTRIGSHAAFREQGQRVCPSLALPLLGRQDPRVNQERVD